METKELLAERGKTHGDFTEHAEATQTIKAVMYKKGKTRYTTAQQEGIDMIAHKLGRIASGDPNHKDHWDDIAGYAVLVAERLG